MSTKTFTRDKGSTIPPPPPTTPKLKLRRRKTTTKHHRKEPNNRSSFHDQENEINEAHLALSNPLSRKLGSEEEKWMFQADLLRAECKMLRAERFSALKKLQENRVDMEMSLRSAIQTLVSAKIKISEGDNVNDDALDREIEKLSVKLKDLQKSSTTSVEYGDELKLNDDEENKCSGRCKAVIRKILEQVVAETEQWSAMQEMLGRVRIEMEQLQASRDYWENRARDFDSSIRFLRNDVEEWKAKARDYKDKTNRLLLELTVYQRRKRLEKQKHRSKENNYYGDFIVEEERKEPTCKKDLAPVSLAKQIAKEKKMMIIRRQENERCNGKKVESYARSPLHDLGINNSSALVRNHGINLSFRSVEDCRINERSFRK